MSICSVMLPGMPSKTTITIVGAGNLGRALAVSLHGSGYVIDGIVSRPQTQSVQKAGRLAKEIGARVLSGLSDAKSRVIWLCVPDSEIARAASELAPDFKGKGRIVLHSSGALASDELASFRRKGAKVASVHPLMTFVSGSHPSLAGVSFAIEGDPPAVRAAWRIVVDLGGQPYSIRKKDKAAYHAWSTFICPLLTSLLATGESIAELAGIEPNAARRRALPILLQTLANYASFGASGAFSGPIVRGDVDTVKRHLRALRRAADREAYVSLARAALQYLPSRNRNALRQILNSRAK